MSQVQPISTEHLQTLCSQPNVYELEERHQLFNELKIALISRNYNLNLLEQRDDGWYLADYKIGNTIKEAYLHIVEWW